MLLLDEPTGNLDSSTAKEIVDLVLGLNRDRGLTALMVTHEKDTADAVSDRVIRLLDGSIAEDSGRRASP
jgi:putative ABC transport system ATP-binding protein